MGAEITMGEIVYGCSKFGKWIVSNSQGLQTPAKAAFCDLPYRPHARDVSRNRENREQGN